MAKTWEYIPSTPVSGLRETMAKRCFLPSTAQWRMRLNACAIINSCVCVCVGGGGGGVECTKFNYKRPSMYTFNNSHHYTEISHPSISRKNFDSFHVDKDTHRELAAARVLHVNTITAVSLYTVACCSVHHCHTNTMQ